MALSDDGSFQAITMHSWYKSISEGYPTPVFGIQSYKSTLSMSELGSVCGYTSAPTLSPTAAPIIPLYPKNGVICPGTKLAEGTMLYSPNKKYALSIQADQIGVVTTADGLFVGEKFTSVAPYRQQPFVALSTGKYMYWCSSSHCFPSKGGVVLMALSDDGSFQAITMYSWYKSISEASPTTVFGVITYPMKSTLSMSELG